MCIDARNIKPTLKVVCYGDYIGGEQTNFASLSGTPIDVSASRYAACVMTDAGEVGCWGTDLRFIDSNDDCSNYGGVSGSSSLGNTCYGTYSSSIHSIPLNHPSTEIYIGTTGGCASLNTGAVECWGPIPRLANEALGYPSSSPVYGTNFPSTVWELLPSNSVASQPSQNGVKVLGMDGPAGTLSELRNMCIVLMNGDLQCYGLTYGVFNPNWPSDASTQIFASDQPGVSTPFQPSELRPR